MSKDIKMSEEEKEEMERKHLYNLREELEGDEKLEAKKKIEEMESCERKISKTKEEK